MSDRRFAVTGRVEIIGIDDPELLAQLNEQLRTMLLIRKRTLPGSRDFGLDGNYLDRATPEALNMLARELDEAIQKWIPKVRFIEVRATPNELGAVADLAIVLELNEEQL